MNARCKSQSGDNQPKTSHEILNYKILQDQNLLPSPSLSKATAEAVLTAKGTSDTAL